MHSTNLNKQQLDELHESLHYMNMAELKEICKQFSLSDKGNKASLIDRIFIYAKTGKIVTPQTIPAVSKAQKSQAYPLAPNTLMLYGSYKNDLKTRIFFKHLIGNHFHFTAFGIDWLNERWIKGTPPTYAEFARFWQHEYEQRKKKKAQPKKEWAYINFTQRYLAQHPDASKNEIIKEWESARMRHVKNVKVLLSF